MAEEQVLVEHKGIKAEPRLMDKIRFETLMKGKGWTKVSKAAAEKKADDGKDDGK